ncbi:galactoside O-acetyltransferase [Marinobacterium nitratireducens]|uniref:Chloramphenicol acetyltransferase n=1 Tax=Marinobacterium nitratireducens TaxID=518897 RepID=A0A917Z8J5_9GAMM|nr:acyltransferase [Marinobacterium nitratireducens]GGO78012.1 galactoside O-acetyltransferase [Marinobacterium nitratireducens]
MAYYTDDQLKRMGFKSVGKNVKISDKASIYDVEKIEIGDNSRIDDFCVVSGSLTIGHNVFIGAMCLIAGGEKGIRMEDFSTLSYQVKVFTQSDDYSGETLTNSTVPKKYKSEKKQAVRLGRHVIVGAGATVFPGVDVADGCSIGAMSLVTKSTDEWGVYVGTPARRLKDRKKDLLELEQQYLKEIKNDSL